MNAINELLDKLETVSEEERTVKTERERLEVAIAEAMATEMPAGGGSKSFERDGFKFEVKTGFRFQADLEEIGKTDYAVMLIKTKREFSESAYRKLWDFNKTAAEAMSRFVTATPAKPSVKIKGRVEEAH